MAKRWCEAKRLSKQACSSGGERYLDTVEVGGSKPPTPTKVIALELVRNKSREQINRANCVGSQHWVSCQQQVQQFSSVLDVV